MYRTIGFTLIITLIFKGCVPLDTSQSTKSVPKPIEYDNKNYSSNVGFVKVYNQDVLNPPITPLASQGLILEFDLLVNDYQYVFAKIHHCDADWTKSQLSNLEYFEGYNEIPINDYSFSENTILRYVNYRLTIPKVKLSGNYVISVHHQENPKAPIFSRRFIVTENIVSIEADVVRPNAPGMRESGQRVATTVNVGDLQVRNANTEIEMVIRQNGRWDNVKSGLKPTILNMSRSELEFNFFQGEDTFWAGNEFKIVDLRATSMAGFNVARIERSDDQGVFAMVLPVAPSNNTYYSQPLNEDINGKYVPASVEATDGPLDLEYIYTTFSYRPKLKHPSKVYVIGQFNDWNLDANNLMIYDETTNTYSTNMLLKQGIYNVAYYVPEEKPPYPTDGSYFLTENEYEIIVYHRNVGTFYDRVVGYSQISSTD